MFASGIAILKVKVSPPPPPPESEVVAALLPQAAKENIIAAARTRLKIFFMSILLSIYQVYFSISDLIFLWYKLGLYYRKAEGLCSGSAVPGFLPWANSKADVAVMLGKYSWNSPMAQSIMVPS